MAEIRDYDVDANNNTATPPDGAGEGWAPSTVNNTIRELMARTKRLWEDTSAVNTTTGTSNAYLLSASQTISAYAAGDVFMFVADRANTGAATLAVDGLAAKSLKTVTQAELVADQLTANGIYVAAYDATNDIFQVLGVDESSGTMTLDSLSVDTISEKTASAGVTIDGVLLKDNAVSATAASTVTVADASNEALTITQTGNGGGVLIDDSGTGTALTVTNATAQAAGEPVVVVGTPSSASQAHAQSTGIIAGSSAYGLASVKHLDTNTGGGPGVTTYRSRGTSGSETAVDENDGTGTFIANAYDGTSYVTSGYMSFVVDESNRNVTTGYVPTRFSLILNDGTTNVTPLGITTSATAGYAHTTINGSATLNGNTSAAGFTINSGGSSYTAVTAVSDSGTCIGQLASDTYTFVGSGGVLVQSGGSGAHASIFNCEDAVYSALLTYSQNDNVYTQLSYANAYTMLGVGGTLENRGSGTSSAAYALYVRDSSATDMLAVRNDGLINTGTRTLSPYNYTTATAANMHVNSGGTLLRSTSSGRFKTDVQPLDDTWADKILDLEPVFYKSTAQGDAVNPDWTYYGLIAEDVAAVDSRYVHFDTGEREGEEEVRDPDTNEVLRPARPAQARKPQSEWVADGVQYERLVVPLINIVKRQKTRIETLETQVSDLTAQLAALADRVAALEA